MGTDCKHCHGRYTGAFTRCPYCLTAHWWAEERIVYAAIALQVYGGEVGWRARHVDMPHDVYGDGPTREVALRALRERVEREEARDRVQHWAQEHYGLTEDPPAEDYGPGNLGCFEDGMGLASWRRRKSAYREHKAVADGITAFARWVGEPVEPRRPTAILSTMTDHARNLEVLRAILGDDQ